MRIGGHYLGGVLGIKLLAQVRATMTGLLPDGVHLLLQLLHPGLGQKFFLLPQGNLFLPRFGQHALQLGLLLFKLLALVVELLLHLVQVLQQTFTGFLHLLLIPLPLLHRLFKLLLQPIHASGQCSLLEGHG